MWMAASVDLIFNGPGPAGIQWRRLSLNIRSPMSKTIIKTDKASLPVGPYNQAVSIGNLIYTAGQIPLDRAGQMVPGGIKEQTEQVIQNLSAVLTHGGSSLD